MVTVRVELSDALERETDLLVLKYAQGLYGVDAAAFGRVGGTVHHASLPDVGLSLLVERPQGLGARHVAWLGVAPLMGFGYAEIRRFGHDAVVEGAEVDAAEICVTMHGTGYGLDETEAFRAEVAGVFDAVDAGSAGPALRHVTVVDIDPRRVDRLRGVLRTILAERADPDPSRSESAGLDSDRKRHAFVAMPFADEFTDYFHYGIRPPLTDAGMLCERMDELQFTGEIVAMMEQRIRGADVVVADLTAANPNVYLEVGYAWAAGRPTILLCRGDTRPHFDLRGHRHLRYASIRELERKLRAELTGLGW